MPTGQFPPPTKVPSKWTVDEFWKSLNWSVGDQEGDWDGYLHIHTNIDGSELKLKVADIFHEAAEVQRRLTND